MADEFLVMLYEYSPLFSISVIALCFIITVTVVLGWFGFDVPVILRSSDDTESVSAVPEKRMVQVTNPFALELGATAGTVTEGAALRPCCLEDCILSCFWGCNIQALQAALQSHQHGPRLSTPQLFQQALYSQYYHCQSFNVNKEDKAECLTRMPADLGLSDFGLLPRERYPLVAVLTLADAEARGTYNIVANVTVIHIPDDKYRLSARILFQYLLTAHGSMYELKPLFMSADSGGVSDGSDPALRTEGVEPQTKGPGEGEESEGDWPDSQGKDCVVCQNAPVNRVLLPCRHACVCDGCVARFQHCPMCRAFVIESFTLCDQLPSQRGEEEEGDEEFED
ncbi:cell growth regulator with RING finger domain protein 1 [Chanos chanos]|uniref:Cell growth regulator with RING finger domain protein 1 n=1 Tax=Chanos chanos TaxID=29144 RepID=A0A6J2V9R0_CHACN|nr:cell growth regulator with RING finger domain protein 1 [Chanos chanos]